MHIVIRYALLTTGLFSLGIKTRQQCTISYSHGIQPLAKPVLLPAASLIDMAGPCTR